MVASSLTFIVALIHVFIVVLEMLLWDKPAGRTVFGMTEEYARKTRVLAANQGLYNGFLVAGLSWGLWLGDEGLPIKAFFLSSVVAAGVFGAVTVSRKILYVQAVPAALALSALLLGF